MTIVNYALSSADSIMQVQYILSRLHHAGTVYTQQTPSCRYSIYSADSIMQVQYILSRLHHAGTIYTQQTPSCRCILYRLTGKVQVFTGMYVFITLYH
jgi:ribulose bisphosphate carboxylase small subunit